MLRFLFDRLTPGEAGGEALFAAVTQAARAANWYRDDGVPDTLDGRFRMLATLIALVMVRLEREGDDGDALSVALTEQFVTVMEAEHRELGLGDPALGRTVRKLVAALARRVALWRAAIADETDWAEAARDSLSVAAAAQGLRGWWEALQLRNVEQLAQGRLP